MAQQSLEQSTKPKVPSPLTIALATAGVIDEVVSEGDDQILDLTATASTSTTLNLFLLHLQHQYLTRYL